MQKDVIEQKQQQQQNNNNLLQIPKYYQQEQQSLSTLSHQIQEFQFIIQNQIQLQHSKVLFNSTVSYQTIISIPSSISQHLLNSIKSDKYVRLSAAIIKNIRAYRPTNNLQSLYTQILIFRRIIRWQGTYQTIKELIEQKNTTFQILYNLFKLFGDLVDLSAFWIRLGQPKKQKILIQKLQQIQCNCYFIQCLIELLSYIKCLLKQQEMKSKLKLKIKLKIMKYICDCFTSHNNFSHRIIKLNPKFGALLSLISSLIGIYCLWI